VDLHKLRSFVCIVDQRSFSKAASLLRIAQPALSRQIKMLEEDLGVPLLVRTGRGAVANAAGEILADHARRLLQAAQALRDAVRAEGGQPSGTLSLGVPPSLGISLLPLLGLGFQERFPKVRLHLVEGFSASIHEWILAGRLDMAILYEMSSMGHLVVTPLLEEATMLVGPAGCFAPGARVSPQRLAQVPLVLPARPHRLRLMIDSLALTSQCAIDPVIEIDALPALIEAVRLGRVHTVLPYASVQSMVQRGELTVAEIDTPLATRRMALARPTEKPLSAAGLALEQAIIQLVCDHAQRLRWQPLIQPNG
jgi:LysR family nitrogen assimilation transcriptional regulator